MVPKPYTDITRNENYISVSLIYKDVKILKKINESNKEIYRNKNTSGPSQTYSRNALFNIEILAGVGNNINRIKKKNHGIIPMDAEKASGKKLNAHLY